MLYTSVKHEAHLAYGPIAERAEEVDLSVEYHYVVDDLKLIGLISAVLIAGLVILSFFL